MTPLSESHTRRAPVEPARHEVAGFAGPVELRSLLERILDQAVGLLGCESGSICLVDEAAGTYTKEIDHGVACLQGSTFPLDEGMTGRIVAARGPVILDEYAAIGRGHIADGDPRLHRAVIGVPIRWGEAIVGTCMVFARDRDRLFTTGDVLLLELLAQHAATALLMDRAREGDARAERERRGETRVLETLVSRLEALSPSPESLDTARALARAALARRSGAARPSSSDVGGMARAELGWLEASAGVRGSLTESGAAPEVPSAVVERIRAVLREALQNVADHAAASRVRVGLLWAPGEIQVIVEDDGRGFDPREGSVGGLDELRIRIQRAGGSMDVESTAGWGTRLAARLPLAAASAVVQAPVLVFARPLVGAGLRQLIESAGSRFRVASVSEHAHDAASLCAAVAPVVLLAEADRVGELAHLGVPLVVLVDRPVPEALRLAGEAGARGYLALDADATTVVRVLEAVAHDRFGGGGIAVESADWTRRLTDREREVLGLVVKGETDKRIAAALRISVKTAEKHVGALLKKSGLHNRTMLAAQAAGRTPPPS